MKKRLQTGLLLLLIGMIALCATGCSALTGTNEGTSATATPAPDATVPPQQLVDAEYKLYDKEADFSMSYHSAWKIKNNLSDDGTIDLDRAVVVFTIPEGLALSEEEAATVYPTLNVFRFPIAEAEKETFDLESYVKEQITYLENKVYQFTLLQEISTVQIGNTTAYTIAYVGSVLNTNEVKTKQAFLTDGESVFILTYAANADFYNNENYAAIADKMINSFTLK